MSMDPSVGKEVAHYERLFVKHLDECASWRRSENPEPFLLHARKALEAAVYAVHMRATGQRPNSKSLDKLLEGLVSKGMSAQLRAFCDVIRTQTNPAAHVVEPTESMTAKNVEIVAQTLPDVTKWFLERMEASRGDLKVSVAASLADIGGKTRQPPDAEKERALEELAKLRAEHRTVAGELETSRQKLRHFADGQRASAVRSPSAAPGLRVAIAALLGATGGAALAFVASSTDVLPSATSHTIAPEVPVAAAATAGDPDAAVLGADAASPTDANATSADNAIRASPECPTGMRWVADATVELGQPFPRRDWPQPHPAAIPALQVLGFCVHRAEVTQDDLDRWRRETARSPQPSCTVPQDPEFPAVCITDEEASAYCADRGWSLPSVAEWEVVARVGGVRTSPGTSEWVDDTFPPGVFNRADCGREPARCGHRMVRGGLIDEENLPPEPRVLFAWNAPNPDALARRDLGFRCVARRRPTRQE